VADWRDVLGAADPHSARTTRLGVWVPPAVHVANAVWRWSDALDATASIAEARWGGGPRS
jgi:hypothetical protein